MLTHPWHHYNSSLHPSGVGNFCCCVSRISITLSVSQGLIGLIFFFIISNFISFYLLYSSFKLIWLRVWQSYQFFQRNNFSFHWLLVLFFFLISFNSTLNLIIYFCPVFAYYLFLFSRDFRLVLQLPIYLFSFFLFCLKISSFYILTKASSTSLFPGPQLPPPPTLSPPFLFRYSWVSTDISQPWYIKHLLSNNIGWGNLAGGTGSKIRQQSGTVPGLTARYLPQRLRYTTSKYM